MYSINNLQWRYTYNFDEKYGLKVGVYNNLIISALGLINPYSQNIILAYTSSTDLILLDSWDRIKLGHYSSQRMMWFEVLKAQK